MIEQGVTAQAATPLPLIWAVPTRVLPPLEGNYDEASQQWSSLEMASLATYCRSATTGFISDDPDEDKDD